jgi:hypothetical protein
MKMLRITMKNAAAFFIADVIASDAIQGRNRREQKPK